MVDSLVIFFYEQKAVHNVINNNSSRAPVDCMIYDKLYIRNLT